MYCIELYCMIQCLTLQEVLCTRTVHMSLLLPWDQRGRRHLCCCISCSGLAVSAAVRVLPVALLRQPWTCTSISLSLSIKCHSWDSKAFSHTYEASSSTWNVTVVPTRSHHFWRWWRQVSTGLPMQATCCLRFHWGSSTSVRVTTISPASCKMFTICCSNICNTKTQRVFIYVARKCN